MLLLDVYRGLDNVPAGSIRSLRVVGLTPKTQPVMNFPQLGLTEEDAGKFVVGTVPVESDGSAYFRVPAGVPFFLQALGADGMAVQTMRSAAYVQAGQTYTCVGCHEPRTTTPVNRPPLAASRGPSRPQPGPTGSWPLDFDQLVQPVLDRLCVRCHQPGGERSESNLLAGHAYSTLVSFGDRGTLQGNVLKHYAAGRSTVGAVGARDSALARLFRRAHYDVQWGDEDWERLVTWMDLAAQRSGSFSKEQAQQLRELRNEWSFLLSPRTAAEGSE